jgi:Ala-tRNA(Pro) deacylase
MPVFVEPHLAEDDQIAFNAGSHTELISMAYKDFDRLVHPKLVDM